MCNVPKCTISFLILKTNTIFAILIKAKLCPRTSIDGFVDARTFLQYSVIKVFTKNLYFGQIF